MGKRDFVDRVDTVDPVGECDPETIVVTSSDTINEQFLDVGQHAEGDMNLKLPSGPVENTGSGCVTFVFPSRWRHHR